MNIDTLRTNLQNTIKGKELLLESHYPNNPRTAMFMDEAEAAVRTSTIEFLKINIAELKRILADVDQIQA